jgi:hypothetical protein
MAAPASAEGGFTALQAHMAAMILLADAIGALAF